MSIKEFHPYSIDPTVEREPDSAGLNREPIVEPGSLYQTQAFEVNVAINPLIAAGAPLLTVASQLREQSTAPNLYALHTKLCHEIKAFENKARSLHYHSTIILAARYFLCALIDETILTSTWGENSPWREQNLLRAFQRETWGGERFFVILERISEDPKPHLDLLELGYLCLSLGYEGKYRHKSRGHHELGQLIDKLYYLIRDERGEFSKQLLIAPASKVSHKKSRRPLLSIWLAVGIVVVGLTASYIPYWVHLNKLAKPLYKVLIGVQNKNE